VFNPTLRYINTPQIGINFTDPVFRGSYHGTQRHDNDFEDVIQRALDAGCKKFMITGSDLDESKHAIEIAKAHPGQCYATVGVHPCSAKLFDTFPGGPSALLAELRKLSLEAKESGYAVAFGEVGLDYDRLFLTPKDQQLKYFEAQLEIAVEVQLPLFLHSRAASEDFERLLSEKLEQLPKRGLVHSFTGTTEEMQRLVALGFDVGVNGCSMKSMRSPRYCWYSFGLTLHVAEENIEVVRQIPLERLQIETDGPWVSSS
jgi:TatD DNase family protein